MIHRVDAVGLGRFFRALRIRRGWRQKDLGRLARVSRSVIVRIEGGQADTIAPRRLARVAQALGARLDIRLDWNGEAIDRLLDQSHAALVEWLVSFLGALGWIVATEVTFSIYGERGSVDVLAWHPATRILLIIEGKSIMPDIQGTLVPLDRKARLGIKIGETRGWSPIAVARLLVIANTRTSRRRVEAHGATFEAELPDRAVAVRRWLKAPLAERPLRGLWFVSNDRQASTRHRVRRPSRAA
jgi:transcriptional regulator with XRE-family HTH domain